MKMKKITSAVVGLGNIGLTYDLDKGRTHPSSHAMGYIMDPDYELKYAVEPDVSKWELVRRYAKGCVFFRSLDEFLIKISDEELGVVSICTPPRYHLDNIKNILNANICKMIFCEKPIVSRVDEIAEARNVIEKYPSTFIIPNISRRWSTGLKETIEFAKSAKLGKLKKINGRYTRGIYNTGSHLFDLLYMMSGARLIEVMALDETITTAVPEKSFSFYCRDEKGVSAYFESIDDRDYYMFEVDFYYEKGKVEFRVSGDELLIYLCDKHHLFEDKKELVLNHYKKDLLKESHIKNALDEIKQIIRMNITPTISVEDAIYPMYVAKALEESFVTGRFENVNYVM